MARRGTDHVVVVVEMLVEDTLRLEVHVVDDNVELAFSQCRHHHVVVRNNDAQYRARRVLSKPRECGRQKIFRDGTANTDAKVAYASVADVLDFPGYALQR